MCIRDSVRNEILHNFEELLYVDNKEGHYNIVIVGGGATGVELAGAFACLLYTSRCV